MRFLLMCVLAAGLAGSLPTPATAQSSGRMNSGTGGGRSGGGQNLPPAERAEELTQRMTRQLTLTPDQTRRIKEINLKYATQRGDAKAGRANGNPPAKGSIRTSFEAQDAEIKAVLTPDQIKVYDARKEQLRERHDARKGR